MSRKTIVMAGLALIFLGAVTTAAFVLGGNGIVTFAVGIGTAALASLIAFGFFSTGRSLSTHTQKAIAQLKSSHGSTVKQFEREGLNHLDGKFQSLGEKIDALSTKFGTAENGGGNPWQQKSAEESPLAQGAEDTIDEPASLAAAPVTPPLARKLKENTKGPANATVQAFPRKAEDTSALVDSLRRRQEANSSLVKMARDIRVAMIADEFTYYSFAPEFDIIRLTTRDWRPIFEKYQPEIFICESAWRGGNGKHRPWSGRIAASVNKPHENRADLVEILEYCHRRGIPTVYWNKEDPMYFPNRIYDFSRTAALFDFVFTTAEECVESYRKFVGVANVAALPFAVQPKIFNPQGVADAEPTVNFAGTWYAKYPERGAAARRIMDSVLGAGHELVIYDRMYDSGDERYEYPPEYRKFTRPAIPYFDVADSYKKSKFGITLNTVTDSNTMFARRVFELAASGSVVLSNSAQGVKEFFGDTVLYADGEENVLQSLTDTEYFTLQRGAMEIALQNTYTHRAESILDSIGIKYIPNDRGVAGLAKVESMDAFWALSRHNLVNNYFDEVILVAQGDAPDVLADSINDLTGTNHVVAVSERDLATGQKSIKDLVSTSSVAIRDNDKSGWDTDPSARNIDFLRSHLSHRNGPVGNAENTADRFRLQARTPISGLVVPTAQIDLVLSEADDGVEAFLV